MSDARLQTSVMATALTVPDKSRVGKRPILTQLYRTSKVGKPEKTYSITLLDDLTVLASRVCPAPKSGKEKNYIDKSAAIRGVERACCALLDLSRGILLAAVPNGAVCRVLLFDLHRTRLSYTDSPKHIDLAPCLTSEVLLDEPQISHMCWNHDLTRVVITSPRCLHTFHIADPDRPDDRAPSPAGAGGAIPTAKPRSRSPSPLGRRTGRVLAAGPKVEASAIRCAFSVADPSVFFAVEVSMAPTVSEYHILSANGVDTVERTDEPGPWRVRQPRVGGEPAEDPERLAAAVGGPMDETMLSDMTSTSQQELDMNGAMKRASGGLVLADWEPRGECLLAAHANGALSMQHPDVSDHGPILHSTNLHQAAKHWGPSLGFRPGFEPPVGSVVAFAWHPSGALVATATATGWIFLMDCGLTVLGAHHLGAGGAAALHGDASLQVVNVVASFSPLPVSLTADHIRHVATFPQTLESQRLRLAVAAHQPFQGTWSTCVLDLGLPSDARLLRSAQMHPHRILAAHLSVGNLKAALRVTRGCFDDPERFRCLSQLVSHVFRKRSDPVATCDALEDVFWSTWRYAALTRDSGTRRAMKHIYVKICLYMVQNGELESAIRMTRKMATPLVLEAAYTAALRRGEVHFAQVIHGLLQERTAVVTRTARWLGHAPGDSVRDMGGPGSALIPRPEDLLRAHAALARGRAGMDAGTLAAAEALKLRAGLQ